MGLVLLLFGGLFSRFALFFLGPGFIFQGSNLQGIGQRGLSSRFCGFFPGCESPGLRLEGLPSFPGGVTVGHLHIIWLSRV